MHNCVRFSFLLAFILILGQKSLSASSLDLTSFVKIIHNTETPQEISAKLKSDPTLVAPPAYNLENGHKVYGDAFRRAFEFIIMNFIQGDIAEFGTFRGFTARKIAELIQETHFKAKLHLFDSFEGLPKIKSAVDAASYEVKDTKAWVKGGTTFSHPELIEKALTKLLKPNQLKIHVGFFEDTLQKETLDRKLCLVHIDSDLYESAFCVLSRLFEYDRIQDGTVILFDDWNCGRANPNLGERRAFREVMEKHSDQFSFSQFFDYGWHGAAFIIHKNL